MRIGWILFASATIGLAGCDTSTSRLSPQQEQLFAAEGILRKADDVEFRFIMLVGGKTGETLKFQPTDNMTVGEFFESMDDTPGHPSEDAILQLLKREENAAVLVAFDGEPRTFDLEEVTH